MDVLRILKDIETRLNRIEDELRRTMSQRHTREHHHGKAADRHPFAGPDHAYRYNPNLPTPLVDTHTDLMNLCRELHVLIQSVNDKVQHTTSNNEPNTTINTINTSPETSSTFNLSPKTHAEKSNAIERTEEDSHIPDEDTAAPSQGLSTAAEDGRVERGTEHADATQDQSDSSSSQKESPRGEPAAGTTQDTFSVPRWTPLDDEHLGEALVPFIETMFDSQQPSADGLRSLELTSLEGITGKMRLIYDTVGKKRKTTDPTAVYAMEYSKVEPDIVSLAVTNSRFKFPDYTATPARPTDDETSTCLDSLFSAPPIDNVVYYVGRPLTPHADGILHPGERLLKLQHIPGVNSYYWQAGGKLSGTPLHREDANFRSMNLVMHGYKLWVLIREADTVRFEKFCRKLYYKSEQPCLPDTHGDEVVEDDQWLRHLNLLIHPRRLQEQGISFDMFVAGPGQMVVTGHLQYHQVINLTDCFAISVNFLLSYEPPIQDGMWACSDCGLFPLRHEKIRCVPHKYTKCKRCGKFHLPNSTSQQATGQGAEDEQLSDLDSSTSEGRQAQTLVRKGARGRKKARPAAKKRKLTAHVADREESDPEYPSLGADEGSRVWLHYVIKQDPYSKHAQMPPMTQQTQVFRIFLAIRSSAAVDNLARVVQGFRLECSKDVAVNSYFSTPASNSSLDRIMQLASSCDAKSTIWQVLCLVAQIRFWRQICNLIGEQRNLTEHCWGLIAQDMRKDALTETERKMIRKYRRTGRKLGSGLKGLIPLIPATPLPPCGVQLSDLLSLSEGEQGHLLRLINEHLYSQRLVRIGDGLVKSLEDGRGIRTYEWERQPDLLGREIIDLQHERVLNLMRPA